MRVKMRAALLVAGGFLIAFMALLIVTALTGAQAWAWAAAIAGVLGVVLCVAAGFVAVDRLSRSNARTATRTSNLEKRVDRAREDGATSSDEVSQLRAEVEAVRADSASAQQADALRAQQADTARTQRLESLEEQVTTLERAVRVLRRRVPEGFLDPLEAEVAGLSGTLSKLADEHSSVSEALSTQSARTREAWVLSAESALQLGRRPRSFLTVVQAVELFEHYLEHDQLLQAAPLVRNYAGVLTRLDLGTLRTMYRFYKATGYWDLAALTLRQVAKKSGRGSDQKAVTKLERDTAVFSRREGLSIELPSAPAYDTAGPIVHMVGRLLPETQSGYTLRTHYTAQAQARQGLPVVVVGQSGVIEDSAREAIPYTVDDVDYYRLPGPLRRGVPLDDWLRHDIQELAKLVRRLRPSVLHAHSDFLNALIVSAVGKEYGIPTVYETRGFWEESWLTRAISTNRWTHDADRLFATYGYPPAYSLRKRVESVARSLADHNITLAEVMKDRILDSADGALGEGQVSVVPNAVDPEEFPIQDRDPALAARVGIPEDALTIGYISSMVEYESIETLIDGFKMAAGRVSAPLYLLLVGGGKHLEALQEHAARSGAENIVFTGAVPHDDVLRYYGLIDIFVVPRGKSSVADLVTPLKPFEAFATGRAVLLSDVDALKEIAEDSGAAETFRAGFSRELGRKLVTLVEDPQRRRDLGVRGARWVRSHRTWDRNVTEYYRVYKELGYRGPAGSSLEAELQRRRSLASPVALTGSHGRSAAPRSSETGTAPSEDGQGGTQEVMLRTDQDAVSRTSPPTRDQPGNGRRAVVVAMKPQIAGRIRRNIMTLLELGFEVTVVNSTPRADFFQGLEHPRLSTDFIDVRSMAVRYQARMTRKKNERQVRWDQEKKDRALVAKEPVRDAPEWMEQDLPGMQLLRRGWTSESGHSLRQRLDEATTRTDKRWKKFVSTSRSKRDLTVRDQLKQVHLINRFVEFWRLSPDRIAAHRPDLVVSSDLPGLVGANIAAGRLGVPHLHDCHELYLESTTLRPYERRVLWPVEKAYLRRADSVVIVNETIRDEYEKRYGVRGTVLRNAAPAVAEDVRSNPIDLRASAGLKRDAKIVIYQGGLVPGRGLDVCVRAASHFDEGVHLVLIGKGKMLDELTALADELGVIDRVHFLPAVDPGDLPAYTAAADVGVIPYQPVSRNNEYALPNKAFEYPGAGLPFVAADLPELRRIAQTSRCGEVYDPFDPVHLAEAVRTVLDPERYATYQYNAETFGRENTWESEREILVGEIRRLLSASTAK